jgi:tRNA pseudouridine38-40 synthase
MDLIDKYFRYKIIIEYLGTGLSGWQRQANAMSVQEIIEQAIYRFSGEQCLLSGAGRTDAGVHAIGQVAHFDLAKYYHNDKICHSINHFVRPYFISIVRCENVECNWNARFSAIARHYLYRIVNRDHIPMIDHGRAWWIKKPLNINAMRQGALYMIGRHDFSSFRAVRCQAKSPIRTISNINIVQNGQEVNIYVSARSFLHHMVRNMVGTLVMVGIGKYDAAHIETILEAKRREEAAATAPACGLYFLRVDYE